MRLDNRRYLHVFAQDKPVIVVWRDELSHNKKYQPPGQRINFVRVVLVYLTHIGGLLTICFLIHRWIPTLREPLWATLFLVLMVAEWNLSKGQIVEPNPPFPVVKQIWYRSCWHLGFVLAGLSYVLLADEIFIDLFFVPASMPPWGILWLLTPLSLTDIASRSTRSRQGNKEANSFPRESFNDSLINPWSSVDNTELDSDSTPNQELNSRQIQVFWWSAIALFLVQGLTLFQPDISLIGLGVATFVMFINSCYLKQPLAAAIAIGFSLSFGAVYLGQGIAELPPVSSADWYWVGAIAIFGLWLLRAGLTPQSSRLAQLYAQACDRWAIALSTTELGLLTLQSANMYLEFIPSSWQYLTASMLIGAAILYRYWHSFPKFSIYGISWAIELTIANAIVLLNGSSLILGAANIILAYVTLILNRWWFARLGGEDGEHVETYPGTSEIREGNWRDVLESLPLVYALIGINLRFSYFTPYTGLLTLGAALTGIILGRRRLQGKGITYLFLVGISLAWYELVIYSLIGISLRFFYFTPYTGLLTLGAALIGISVAYHRTQAKGIIYLSLAGISLAWYELVIYQILQSDGGNPGNGLIILALVTAVLCGIYRSLTWFLRSRDQATFFHISVTQIEITAHIHWGMGSVLMVIAAGMSVGTSPNLMEFVGLILSLILASYAFFQGNLRIQQRQFSSPSPPSPSSSSSSPSPSSSPFFPKSHIWIYAGLTEVVAIGIYARLIWTQLSLFDPWRAIIASLFAIAVYQTSWWRWGWNDQPWQRYATILPLLSILINPQTLSSFNLLVLAGFYSWVTNRQSNLRWTYLSLFFIDWAIWRVLQSQQVTEPLAYAAVIGYFFLYIAQIDPELRLPQKRNWRHYIRLLGSGIICLVALGFHQDVGLIPGIISLIAIVAGLGLQVRAFLMVGTVTFIFTVFYQLVYLGFRYPFSKWIMLIIAGIIFISITANIVKRREPILDLVQDWIDQWREWE
ncbi:MAG: hypothetical protein RH949_06525 [Coleofasciculus sp. A1-SPW-01]|uniref:hypothetical protein n=1 Tax=Coleofasciculus sp. A1-SPW-01 TaxID=3070819 RepID=UPI003301AD00